MKIRQSFRAFKTGPHEKAASGMLHRAIKCLQSAVIVLDGLDECQESTQKRLCSMLVDFARQSASTLKVLTSCRLEERPLAYLRDFAFIEADASATSQDIELYVTKMITSNIEDGSLTCKASSLRVGLVDTLVAKAGGM